MIQNKLVFFICFFSIYINGQSTFLQEWSNHEYLQGTVTSYYFMDASKIKSRASHNETILLNPASTLKLLTSFIFLEKFGPSYQFETAIKRAGSITNDGTLEGDIIIYGNGDPALGSKRFGENISTTINSMATAIQHEGITCIDGNLVIDASYYGTDVTPNHWNWNDLGNYYAAGAWSVNINENIYDLYLPNKGRVGENLLGSRTIPEMPYFRIENELTIGTPKSGDQAYIFCAPYQYQAFVRGSIPQGNGQFKIQGSLPNPPYQLGYELQKELSERGIHSQNIQVVFDKKKGKTFHTIPSPKAKDLVSAAIKESINLYCESFLTRIGNGNKDNGVETIENYMKSKNISSDPINIDDGSGLSQRNLITSKTLSRFLYYQYNKRPKSVKSLLARSGSPGTLKSRFVKNGLKGKVYGKSGSMGGVRSYTGILVAKSGKELIFTIMVNHYTVSNWKIVTHIEKLVEHIYHTN